MPLSKYSETAVAFPKRESPENRTPQPDELPICILIVLFLILYNKPCSPCNLLGDETEQSLLSGRTVLSKSSPRHLRSSDHRMAQQDLRWKLLARQQFAQTQTGAKQKGLISRAEKPVNTAPIWT
jgi:hypothetical protein